MPDQKTGIVLPEASGNEDIAKNKDNSMQKTDTLNVSGATLKTFGNPLLRINEMITIAGCNDTDNGNYWIKTITHNISAGQSYTTDTELAKNATPTKKDNPSGKKKVSENPINKTDSQDKKTVADTPADSKKIEKKESVKMVHYGNDGTKT